MADFPTSPSVGQEVAKGSTRYRFNGLGWSPAGRPHLRDGTLVVSRTSWFYKASAGQTVISGSDVNSSTLSYDVNAEIEVRVNGIKIRQGASEDYVLTNSSTITLNDALDLNNEVEITQLARFYDTSVTKAHVDSLGVNAAKVNNKTVETSVPSGAVFTDTVYTHPTNHAISKITGLQTALDGKVDDSQVLTNVPSGAVFTDTVYSKPASEPISYVSGLQTALDGKVDDSQVLTNVPTGAVFTDTNTVYTHPSTHAISEVSGLQTALDGKTTETYVDSQITNLVGSAPANLNTLQELGDALSDDANFASTVTTSLAGKVDKVTGKALSANDYTTAEKNKLSGIATSANNYSLPSSVVHDTEKTALHGTDALRISGHTVSLHKGDGTSESVTVPDNNTTYSVGDGGLTQKNFTSTLKTKLDGIATSANNYSHPATHPASMLTGALPAIDGSALTGLPIPTLDAPSVSGSTSLDSGSSVTQTIANWSDDINYVIDTTNCSTSSINSSGQFTITHTSGVPSYTIKATTDSLGLSNSTVVTKNLLVKLSAPTLNSPADVGTAENFTYVITSTDANDNKIIIDYGSSNFNLISSNNGTPVKVGNTVEITGFSGNPEITIQFTAEATYSVRAKSANTSGSYADSNWSSYDSVTVVNVVWNTASGDLGTIYYHARASSTFTVSASGSGSISYSISGGSLPTGGSINSSTGVISFSNNWTSTSTYNFTVRASNPSSYVDRSFSMGTVTETSVTFNYTGGDQSFTTPAGVTVLYMDVRGAGGGNSSSSGGTGGRAYGYRNVSGGQVYKVRIGQAGSGGCTGGCSGFSRSPTFGGGGGSYEGNSGGGGSYIALSSMSHGNLVAVGGGGGGGGCCSYSGGNGGGDTGSRGGGTCSGGGVGGSQTAGGSGTSCLNGGTHQAGSAMQGGHTHRSYVNDTYGGGGGGGYYGGSSGYRQGGWQHSGGGGGSGYIGGLFSATNQSGGGANPQNHGYAYIKY